MPYSNFCKAELFLQPGCTGDWEDITGDGASVAVDGGETSVGEIFTFGKNYPIVLDGKPGRINVTARVAYTEAADEATELLRAAYETNCDRSMCIRWVPRGSTGGNKMFTTVSGILISAPYPGGEANSPDPTTIEFTITCPRIEVADVV